MSSKEGFDTIVIGGGQAGLAAGYYLTQAGEDCVILDENLRSGETWRMLAVDGIVWATGFKPDYSWIRLPIFDETGRPRHIRGAVPEAPGLYFLGLHFQNGLTSSLLGGVGSDARYVTRCILDHQFV